MRIPARASRPAVAPATNPEPGSAALALVGRMFPDCLRCWRSFALMREVFSSRWHGPQAERGGLDSSRPDPPGPASGHDLTDLTTAQIQELATTLASVKRVWICPPRGVAAAATAASKR